MARLIYLNRLYGRDGKFAVGKTKFWQDFVYNGTNTTKSDLPPRERLVAAYHVSGAR